ncbi:hypothetical protein [Kineosporia babensis]
MFFTGAEVVFGYFLDVAIEVVPQMPAIAYLHRIRNCVPRGLQALDPSRLHGPMP